MLSTGLAAAAGLLDVGGGLSMVEGGYPSLAFTLGLHAVVVGLIAAMFALVVRRSTDAVTHAFDLGVEVGERRAKSAVQPHIMRNRTDR